MRSQPFRAGEHTMPLVFVHGVNVRKGVSDTEQRLFQQEQLTRDELFRSISLKDLIPTKQNTLKIANPYWGEFGAKFDFDLKSVPVSGTELFGGEDADSADALAGMLPLEFAVNLNKNSKPDSFLLDLAQQDPAKAMPLVLDILTLVAAKTEREDSDIVAASKDLSAFSSATAKYLQSNPDLHWVKSTDSNGTPPPLDDGQFLDRLSEKVETFAAKQPQSEKFGGSALLDHLKKAAQTIGSIGGKVVATVAGAVTNIFDAAKGAVVGGIAGAAIGGVPHLVANLARPKATRTLCLFFGDVFVYLGERDDNANIRKTVEAAILEAHIARTDEDPLIIVAHSMGGDIVYDILTHYHPEVTVDLFLSVGSQVALFKEMRLFKEDEATPLGQKPALRKKPDNILNWVNVFDEIDVLGFATKEVFTEVKDFAIDNKTNLFETHGSYFLRPFFHERLRARISEMGLKLGKKE